MPKRYRALRTISLIYKVLGVLVTALSILSAIGACLLLATGGAAFFRSDLGDLMPGGRGRDYMPGGLAAFAVVQVVSAAITTLLGLLAGLGLYAGGEILDLLIAVEENTRAMSLGAQRTAEPHPTAPPPAG